MLRQDLQADRTSNNPVQNDARASDQDQVDLIHILRIVWLGKWTIAFCALIFGALMAYYSLAIAQPKYTASTTLALQDRDQQVVNLESVMSGVSTELAAINTELEVIRSRGLIDELTVRLKLLDDPEFNPVLQELPLMSVVGIRSLAGDYIPGLPTYERDALSEEEVLIRTSRNVGAAINVTSKRNTYLFTISATSERPEKARLLANTLAEIYLEDQVRIKFEATEYAIVWLSEKVGELEVELREKETKLSQLRSDSRIVNPEALEALFTRSKGTRDRLENDKATFAEQSALVNDYILLSSGQSLAQVAPRLATERLQTLVIKLATGDQEQKDNFLATLPQLLQQEKLKLQRTETQMALLEQSQEELLNEIQVQNMELNKLDELSRESNATRILYETFLTRLKEASVQAGLQQADSRVLSMAIPGEQVQPRFVINVAVGMFLGVFIGLGISLFRVSISEGFLTPDSLESASGRYVMGQIPNFNLKKRERLLSYLNDRPTSAVVEGVRNLRTSIQLSEPKGKNQVIMLSSSISGEGKTTLSIALAHSFGSMGKNVLLIEGDIRRCTFSNYFESSTNRSFQSLLSGEASLKDVVLRPEGFPSDVIMGENGSANAADTFSSLAFQSMIDKAREMYDVIIIDTPPVMVVPDARVIAQYADTVLFCVKWRSTPRELVRSSLRMFDMLGKPVSGMVLSNVKKGRSDGSYDYHYYGKDYYGA